MKSDKIFRLSWSVITVLLATIDTTSTGLVSAAPALISRSFPKIGNIMSNGLSTDSDNPSAFDAPTDTENPLSKRRLAPYWSTRQVSAEHIRKRDYLSATITPEEESESESESESEFESVDGVGLSKRRMINSNIYRWIMLTRTKKRSLPTTTIAPEEGYEFESENGIYLSRRRMRQSGQIQTVHPDDY
ncbi:hypothetical protein BGZ47_008387 [Haplosporangium gracile]|nr:hypothetical protein BGZ47_008387 [Haplosporangium gracile]